MRTRTGTGSRLHRFLRWSLSTTEIINETYGYKCGECGHETPLEKLRPLFMHCKCGKSFSYKTNLTADRVTHTCLACKAPVDLELNSRKTAYVTVGERR